MTSPQKPDKFDERAETILQRWRSAGYLFPHGEIESAVQRELSKALRDLQAEVLEKAAKVADGYAWPVPYGAWGEGGRFNALKIAAVIRALAHPPEPSGVSGEKGEG